MAYLKKSGTALTFAERPVGCLDERKFNKLNKYVQKFNYSDNNLWLKL